MRLIHGDALTELPRLPAGSVDAVVADPPGGINFMSKEWDSDRGGRNCWVDWLANIMEAAIHCLKPGGYALVWALPRTSHWTACALEDAGFEIRDRIAHVFGQGFPKGKGCLKPAVEDWWLCRKPGPKVLPLNVDGCRVGTEQTKTNGWKCGGEQVYGNGRGEAAPGYEAESHLAGRWPPNLLLGGEAAALVDEMSGVSKDRPAKYAISGEGIQDPEGRLTYSAGWHGKTCKTGYATEGGASRFFPVFYCPKASRRDRGEGNTHPTCKNTALMRWLVRLVSFPGQTVLDPFAGSGSTLVACALEGREFVGVEREAAYVEIARRRIAEAEAQAGLFAPESGGVS